jgi:hypothetical protein
MDFEHQWQKKLGDQIESKWDEQTRKKVLDGGDQLNDTTPRDEVIDWSRSAIEQLETIMPIENARDILTQCACHYPPEALLDLQKAYRNGASIEEIHSMLRDRFETFLSKQLNLTPEEVEIVLSQDWGLAGRLDGRKIVATKIPKSGFLREYLAETDPQRKRDIYCHCPRVRDAIKLGKAMPRTYCYCGAGFYKDLWETILDAPVEVEVISTVLQGDDVCTVEVILPSQS